MHHSGRSIFAIALAAAGAVAFTASPACRRDDGTAPNPRTAPNPSAGPAQRTGARVGEKLDEGAVKVKEGTKSAASAVGTGMEKAGQKIKPKD